MKPRLIERGLDAKATREIPLKQGEFLIGRGTDCELRLSVADVSRHHCLIRLANNDATIEDLGSSNGTFLNGQRIRSQTPLKSGDLLQIAECQFIVDLGDLGWAELGLDTVSDPAAATVRRNKPPAPGKKEAKDQQKP
jgi:pSer/pThr/pTyr-binding forkhead associated (FHA) protein